MWQKIKRMLGGYLYIRLTGFTPERFLNLCMANQIVLWDLVFRDGGCQFYVEVKDYRRVRPLARKAKIHLKILRKQGLPFFLQRNRKRKLYGAGVVCFFLILFLMSQFIWNISLEGNRRFTDDMLLQYLDTLNVRYGMRKEAVDCDLLEESIRSHYPEIIWVSARISGTRLLIRVKENEVMGTIPVKDESPQDLTADRAGIVTRMVVRKGKAQVSAGDEITPGQILVSGQVPIVNDAGETVNVQYVRADADIYAKTEEVYAERIPKLAKERVRTGRMRRGIRVRFFNRSALFLLPRTGELFWEFTAKSSQACLFQDFYLPIWFDRITAREYSLAERPWRLEELEILKNQIHQQKMQTFMKKGVQIIENDVKILDKQTHWEVQGRFVLEQPVGTGQPPEMSQEQKQEEETVLPDERN